MYTKNVVLYQPSIEIYFVSDVLRTYLQMQDIVVPQLVLSVSNYNMFPRTPIEPMLLPNTLYLLVHISSPAN
jgi:hypothetical protein